MEKNAQVVPFPTNARPAPVKMTSQQIVALRQEIARAPSTRKLQLILDAPSPRAVVQSMFTCPQRLTLRSTWDNVTVAPLFLALLCESLAPVAMTEGSESNPVFAGTNQEIHPKSIA